MINEIKELKKVLYSYHRSLTGDGCRNTLMELSKLINIKIIEVPSGEKAFDWKIPKEWNINRAYIIDPNGNKILDTESNNLHIVSYSKNIFRILRFFHPFYKVYSSFRNCVRNKIRSKFPNAVVMRN